MTKKEKLQAKLDYFESENQKLHVNVNNFGSKNKELTSLLMMQNDRIEIIKQIAIGNQKDT